MHGGAAPQVQRTARERLNALAEPSVRALAISLRGAVDERDWRAVSSIAKAILDRTGHGPGSTVELTGEVEHTHKTDTEWMQHLRTDELRAIVTITERATARGRGEQTPNVRWVEEPVRAALPPSTAQEIELEEGEWVTIA